MTQDAEILEKIARQASLLINDNLDVKQKGSGCDLVTNFDYEIEKFITSEMKKHYPYFNVISEEFNSDGKLSDNCFTIDPIDGTVNFANNIPSWGIQIALVKNGKTCAAVIYLPKLNEMFVADDKAAYLNSKKISVNNLPIKNCLFDILGGNRAPAIARMRKFTSQNRHFGSAAVAFAFVACGRFGGAIFRNNSAWDYLPGEHITKMAGGYIIDEPNCHIVANNKQFADILKEHATKKDSDK